MTLDQNQPLIYLAAVYLRNNCQPPPKHHGGRNDTIDDVRSMLFLDSALTEAELVHQFAYYFKFLLIEYLFLSSTK